MFAMQAQAYPGESIVRDPVTGNYTITYVGESADNLSQTVFVPSTKIEPTIRSRFHLMDKWNIAYRFSVSNGATARQAINGVLVDGVVNPIIGELPHPELEVSDEVFKAYVVATRAATPAPVNWKGDITRDEELKRIAWRPQAGKFKTTGIFAGQTLSGFGFSSLDLPGMGDAKVDGFSEIFGFPDDGPIYDSAILDELNRLRDNDFVSRIAAIPVVAVPNPFDAAILLDRIRTEIQTWPGKQLLDTAYAAQLDRYMVAAAEACRLNNTKAAREHIHTLRKLLAKEHHHVDHDDEDNEDTEEHKLKTRRSIDRLAARVLDFDLRYVLKRTEQGHGKDGHGKDDHRKEDPRKR
jgi:hypothetical protein